MRICIAVFLLLPLLIPSAAFARACQPDHPDRPMLVGQWNWRYTYDVHGGDTTPASLGVTRTLDLRDDGTYDLFEDGVSIEGGAWCLRECETNVQDNCTSPRVILYLQNAYPFFEWNYEPCDGRNCEFILPGLTEGLRIEAIDHSAIIRLYEPVTTVPTQNTNWSAVKARF